MIRCFIGLGSNLEQPIQQVSQAITELANMPSSQLGLTSPWYVSKAIGPGEQPDYINGVVELFTTLEPLNLLDELQTIEKHHHRRRVVHWGARTLDLDLLVYGNQSINHPRLTVPHVHMFERNFVLFPLYDIAPELTFTDDLSLAHQVQSCSKTGISLLANGERQ